MVNELNSLLYIIGVNSMKFKIIFILFNIVILFSFLIIFFLPFFMLGWEYTKEFWLINWYLPIIFTVILAILNYYFISNWKIFQLLEKEDWKSVYEYILSQLKRGKAKKQHIKILVNSCIVNQNIDGIKEGEVLLHKTNKKLLEQNALQFGYPYLLSGDPIEMEKYFSKYIHIKGKKGNWIRLLFSFSLVLQKKFESLNKILIELCESAKNPIILVLTLYLSKSFTNSDKILKELLIKRRRELLKKYDKSKLLKEVENNKSYVQFVVLNKLIHESLDWLFDLNT